MLGFRPRSVARICPLMSRCASTRPKKVEVQLLKDNYGKRFKGEVFQVSEGHMRLKLHPEGAAAYVSKSQPPPLPVLSQSEAQNMRREAHIRLKEAEKAAEEVSQQETQGSNQEQIKVQSLIDALDFPSASQQDAKPASPPPSSQSHIPESEPQHKKFEWQSDLAAKVADNERK